MLRELCRSPNFLPWRSIENCPTIFSAVAERYKDESDVVRIMVLIHLGVGLSLYVISRRASRELDAPEDYCLFSKVNALNGRGLHLVSFSKNKPLGWLVENIELT